MRHMSRLSPCFILFIALVCRFSWVTALRFNARPAAETAKQKLFCIGKEMTPIPPPTTGKNGPDGYWRTSIDPDIVTAKKERFSVRPTLITFDAVDTLIMPSQSIGRWYREALNSACDMEARLPRPALFYLSFQQTYEEMSKAYPCFGALNSMSSSDWWYQCIEKTYLNTQQMTLTKEEISSVMPKAFDLLHNEIFGSADGWEVKEDVTYVLDKLRDWRDKGSGPKLGVISNYDDRLREILKALGLDEYFNFILTSQEMKCEKPSGKVFEEALKRAKLPLDSQESAFHIGTSLDKDIYAAAKAKWQAIHFKEDFDDDFPDWTEIDTEKTSSESAKRRLAMLDWGRRNTALDLEWCEIWGIDDLLHLFGFPEDEQKMIRTTYVKGFMKDF